MRHAIPLFGLLLAGCATVQADLPKSAIALPDHYTANASTGDARELTDWWQGFGDQLLSDLMAQALASSPRIDLATARVRQARASLRATQSQLFPSLTGSASANRTEVLKGQGGSQSGYQAGFDASYEVDLFGGVGASVRGSRAALASTQLSLGDAQRLLASEVALNYVLFRNTQSRLTVARSNLSLQRNTRDIAAWRVQAGLASSLDLEQAQAQLAQTEASIPDLVTSLTGYENRLATLVGQPAGSLHETLASNDGLPATPAVVSPGLPADLLRQRPDVLAAQYDTLAAAENVGVARADLFPSLRLGGSISTSAANVSGLFDTLLGNLVASLTGPIFEGGRRRANLESAKAQLDASVANYRGAVLLAYEEAENALTQVDNSARRTDRLQAAAEAAQNARTLASSQYQAGLIDFRTLLDAERTLLSAQDSLTTARSDQAIAAIQLYKALGGGWHVETLANASNR